MVALSRFIDFMAPVNLIILKVTLLKKGDTKAFKYIFEYYFEKLVGYSYKITKDKDVSKDIVQELFIKVWKNKSKIKEEFIEPYLYKSTYNSSLNYIRNQKKFEQIIPYSKVDSVLINEDNSFIKEDKRMDLLKSAISQLPRRCKEIFLKTKLQNLSYKQTAIDLNISEKTVERQVSIALKKIRTFINNF